MNFENDRTDQKDKVPSFEKASLNDTEDRRISQKFRWKRLTSTASNASSEMKSRHGD